MKSVPDYSAYHRPDSSQPNPLRSSNGPFEIILMSIVLGTFFALLAFGMMFIGDYASRETHQTGGGFMRFHGEALVLMLIIWTGMEGAVGGFFASLALISALRRQSLGRIMGRTLLIHSIPVSVLGFVLGAFKSGAFCGLWALVGGSFAITSTLIALRKP